jgi:hypothetical protein
MIVLGLWLLGHTPGGDLAGPPVLTVLVGGVLTALAVLCFGWVEDLAARRAPALLPATALARAPLPARLVPPARPLAGHHSA